MNLEKRKEATYSLVSYLIIFYILLIPFTRVFVDIVTNKFNVSYKEFTDYYNSSIVLSHESFTNSPLEKAYLMFNSLSNTSVYIVLILALIFFNWKSLLTSIKGVKDNYVSLLQIVILGFFAYLGINILVGIINDALKIETDSQNQILLELMIKHGYLIPTIITAVIIGPIVEEVIFRKSFYDLLQNNIILARVVSSLIFASIHLLSSLFIGLDAITILALAIPYFLFGYLFAIIYEKAKFNILPSILIHVATNLMSILMIYFQSK